MERLHHHLRPLAVALATLALSAGVVLAGGGVAMPDAAGAGLERAAEAAGKTVPVVNAPAVPAKPEIPAKPDAPEQPATPDAPEAPATPDEPEQPATPDEPADEDPCPPLGDNPTHGALVCAAAHADVPDGYANRGAYVSEVARQNHGAEVRAQKAANGGRPDAATKGQEKAKEARAQAGKGNANGKSNGKGAGGGRP